MSTDYDIKMGLDETLELDTIIKEWADAKNIINYNTNEFTVTGIQKNIGVINPDQAGTHTIDINGQKLKIKVTDPNNIPSNQVYHYKFENDYTDSLNNFNLNSVTESFDTTSKYGTYAFSKNENGTPFAKGENNFWDPFKSTNELTMTCWVQPFQNDQNYSDLITNEKNNWRFGIGNGANGNQYVFTPDDDITVNSSVPTDSYTFFAIRASGSSGELSIRIGNTTEEISTQLSSELSFSGYGVHLIGSGGADGNNNTWDGRVDDMRFFNRYLSDSECDQIRNI